MAGNLTGEVSGIALVVIGSLMTMAAGLTFISLLIERLRRREQSQP